MARRCIVIGKAIFWPLLYEMVDIGSSDKITNLWPAPPSRPIEKSGHKNKSRKETSDNENKKDDDENEIVEDGPGKNIDEYV